MYIIRQSEPEFQDLLYDTNVLYTKRIYGIIIKILIYASLFLAGLSFQLYSQSTGGGYAESYLYRNVGARAVAMAGAYTAIVNEPGAIFYNPSGLGFFANQPMVATTFSPIGFGRTHASMAWGQTVDENIGVGFGINSYSSGAFQGRDVRGNKTVDLQSWQYSLTGSAAYRIESASIGASVKYLRNQVSGTNTSADGFALDIGTKFNVMDLFSVGMAVNNISGMMMWNTADEEQEFLPYSVRAGIAMEFGLNEESRTTRSTITGELENVYVPATRYVLVALDAILTQFEMSPSIVLGVEVSAHELLAFRGGIAIYGEDMGQPKIFPMTTWGGGISLRPELDGLPFKTHLDYTISNEYITNSGIGHHISLLFEF